MCVTAWARPTCVLHRAPQATEAHTDSNAHTLKHTCPPQLVDTEHTRLSVSPLQEFYGDGLAECDRARWVGAASSGGTVTQGQQCLNTHTQRGLLLFFNIMLGVFKAGGTLLDGEIC